MDISTSSSYRDFVWAVKLHRFGLEMIGLWPKTNKFANKRKFWSEIRVGIILLLIIFVTNVPMTCAITQVWGDMILVIDNLQSTLSYITVSMKYVIMRWNQKVIFSIVNMMAEDWMAFKLDTERDVMIRRARTARLIMVIGYVFLVMGFLAIIIRPYIGNQLIHATNFTDRSKSLPLETYHFYDTDKSPQFELTFCIQAIAALLTATIYMSVDIFLILIILHLCGQLENFRCHLTRLASCKNFSKVLNNIIARHLRLIKFADNIENMYSFMLLILILHFGLVFGLGGFLFTIVLIDKEIAIAQVYYSTIFLIILLVNTFLYCGAGELIAEQCNAVHRAICDLEWYKLESRKARNIILLMIRANHPFRITAGKIIPITMATFCTVLKTSSGYVSFLLAKHG